MSGVEIKQKTLLNTGGGKPQRIGLYAVCRENNGDVQIALTKAGNKTKGFDNQISSSFMQGRNKFATSGSLKLEQRNLPFFSYSIFDESVGLLGLRFTKMNDKVMKTFINLEYLAKGSYTTKNQEAFLDSFLPEGYVSGLMRDKTPYLTLYLPSKKEILNQVKGNGNNSLIIPCTVTCAYERDRKAYHKELCATNRKDLKYAIFSEAADTLLKTGEIILDSLKMGMQKFTRGWAKNKAPGMRTSKKYNKSIYAKKCRLTGNEEKIDACFKKLSKNPYILAKALANSSQSESDKYTRFLLNLLPDLELPLIEGIPKQHEGSVPGFDKRQIKPALGQLYKLVYGHQECEKFAKKLLRTNYQTSLKEGLAYYNTLKNKKGQEAFSEVLDLLSTFLQGSVRKLLSGTRNWEKRLVNGDYRSLIAHHQSSVLDFAEFPDKAFCSIGFLNVKINYMIYVLL